MLARKEGLILQFCSFFHSFARDQLLEIGRTNPTSTQISVRPKSFPSIRFVHLDAVGMSGRRASEKKKSVEGNYARKNFGLRGLIESLSAEECNWLRDLEFIPPAEWDAFITARTALISSVIHKLSALHNTTFFVELWSVGWLVGWAFDEAFGSRSAAF